MLAGEKNIAGIAANVRVYSMTMQEIGGINARLGCWVLGTHKAELIGYEMGLWMVAHQTLVDCLRIWGFSDGGADSVLMTEHYYDRQSMFNATVAKSPFHHGPIIQDSEAQSRSRFPAALFPAHLDIAE